MHTPQKGDVAAGKKGTMLACNKVSEYRPFQGRHIQQERDMWQLETEKGLAIIIAVMAGWSVHTCVPTTSKEMR